MIFLIRFISDKFQSLAEVTNASKRLYPIVRQWVQTFCVLLLDRFDRNTKDIYTRRKDCCP